MIKNTNERVVITLPKELLVEARGVCEYNKITLSQYIKELLSIDIAYMNDMSNSMKYIFNMGD